MSTAYVETTVLTDILLKPNSPKQKRARAALDRFENTLLPVYSIKEWKAGPLKRFAFIHNKFVQTGSFADTLTAISALGPPYLHRTSTEAIAAAAQVSKRSPQTYAATNDRELADSYRLALYSLIVRSWEKRRRITTQVVHELPCYIEAAPHREKNGLLNLRPEECDRDQECCLADELRAEPRLLEALRDAIPETSAKPEHRRRRRALKRLISHPRDKVDRDLCRDLGDAIFAFFCPKEAVILTTNLSDIAPLAKAVGKTAQSPAETVGLTET